MSGKHYTQSIENLAAALKIDDYPPVAVLEVIAAAASLTGCNPTAQGKTGLYTDNCIFCRQNIKGTPQHSAACAWDRLARAVRAIRGER